MHHSVGKLACPHWLSRPRIRIQQTINANDKGYICVTDVGNVIGASKDRELLEAVNRSLLSVPDGMPLVWYARLVGCKNIERIAGADLMARLLFENNGYKHYLLGDTEQTIRRVIEKAESVNGQIRISGYSPPYKKFEIEDNASMVDRINTINPDIIWLSFGGGKQEKWMHQNFSGLNRGIIIGVGAAFKWFIGDLITPPRIFQKMGLQWLFRIGQGLVENPKTCLYMIKQKEFIKRKMIFIANFRHEVTVARQQLKSINNRQNFPE